MNAKNLVIATALILTGSLFAQNSQKAELQRTANSPEIQKELRQPDGAAIFLKEDGSFQIFARGTGTYDFDDVDEENDARQEGTLKAKAAIAKFMKEKLSTEEGFSNATKKVKSITSDGQTQTSNVTKQSVKVNSQVIKNSAEALLKGVITLREQKIPRKGSSGEIQVTVGISSKTLKAVGKLVNALDATPEQGKSGSAAGNGSAANFSNNRAEVRTAITDF